MTRPRAVIVTGGSRGLGAALVQSFLDTGDRVATCSRAASTETNAWSQNASLEDRFLYLKLDLTEREACESFVSAVVERFGQIDVLVNNAGVAHEGVLGLARYEDIEHMIDLNLKSSILLTRQVTRRMLRYGSGRVINVSSVVGLSGYRGLSVYSATKSALDGFTRALARELGPRGITVNSVAPGYLRTEMAQGLDEEQLQQIVRRTPVGRLGEPGDITSAVHFLASPEAAFITGHVLVIDGGLTA